MIERRAAAWLSLLAPLPPGVRPERKPVGKTISGVVFPEGGQEDTGGAVGNERDEKRLPMSFSPIAGWEDLLLDLSDTPFGHRIVSVLLDASGQPIAASDHVLLRAVGADGAAPPVHMRQESVGGRIEADGTFNGTHWVVEGPEPEGDEAPAWTQTPRKPTDAEQARLLELVREVLSRAR